MKFNLPACRPLYSARTLHTERIVNESHYRSFMNGMLLPGAPDYSWATTGRLYGGHCTLTGCQFARLRHVCWTATRERRFEDESFWIIPTRLHKDDIEEHRRQRQTSMSGSDPVRPRRFNFSSFFKFAGSVLVCHTNTWKSTTTIYKLRRGDTLQLQR